MTVDPDRCEQLATDNDRLRTELTILRVVEKRFRTTLYAIGDAVIATDEVGCVQQMNAVAETLTGWSESEAIGLATRDVFRVIDERTRVPAVCPVRRVLNEGKVVGLANHTLLVARDGTERPIADSAAPIVNDEGTIVGVVLVFRDQTAERRARAALEEAQAVARMGSWDWDAVIDVITGSNEFYRLFDVEPADIATFSQFIALLHPADTQRVQRDVADAIAQKRPYDTEYRVRLRDGSWRDLSARGRVYVDDAGGPVRMVGTVLDVTETRAAERKANEEALKVSTFLENTTDLVTIVDAEGRLRYVNGAAEGVFGLGQQELVGRAAFDFVHPEDRAATQEAFAGWLADKATSASWENRQVSVSGQTRHMLWTIMPRYVDGRLDAVWSIARDITERKQAEIALAHLNERLRRSNQELEQFAYVASHDLQEPLRMVASYTQLLAERYEGKLDEKADKYIGYAVDGAKRMQGLINDLLSFSRLGTRGRQFEPTDCNAVVAEVLRDLSHAIESSGAQVVVGDLPMVHADPTQLRQVFQNLIGNGIKFRGEAPPRVEVSATCSNDMWELCVTDNGIGIDAAFHERIFVIFQRLHERGKYPGSGLGLAIVKKVVERHGGTVRVDSSENGGSRFTFTLPTSPPQSTDRP